MAPKEMQGKVLGLSQSVQSFAMNIGPAIGGIAFKSSLQLPFLIAAGTSVVAVVIYYFILKHR
jgi:predicted MFS family arabinose efflux permease